jgi:tetratricopeptide (TPR) repeat protein
VASVREALGIVHYRRAEWSQALAEFRTARRLSGSNHLIPQMADTERGLGRPQRALDLAATPEAEKLSQADRVELAIVVSGARRDMGQDEAAVASLRGLARTTRPSQPWAARLFYGYADALLATGSVEEAREWFARALDADAEGETDASERLAELDGVELTDLELDAEGTESDGDPSEDDRSGSDRNAGDDGQARRR